MVEVKLEEVVPSRTKMEVVAIGLVKDSALDNTPTGWPQIAPSLAPRMSKAMLIASNGLDKGSASKVLTFPGWIPTALRLALDVRQRWFWYVVLLVLISLFMLKEINELIKIHNISCFIYRNMDVFNIWTFAFAIRFFILCLPLTKPILQSHTCVFAQQLNVTVFYLVLKLSKWKTK